MTPLHLSRIAAVIVPVAVLALACSDSTTPNDDRLRKVIGDIEGPENGTFCLAPGPTTLTGANSIDVGTTGLAAAAADTFNSLVDTTGAVTSVSFAFDTGGTGFGVVFCGLTGGNALETDAISANGPVLLKPWHIAGLEPGATYTMTFTGGGHGTPRRAMRAFVDADGDGTIEAGELQDLIGLDGVVETRTFGPITANANGIILGEYWGGSTNLAGERAVWRGWSIVEVP